HGKSTSPGPPPLPVPGGPDPQGVDRRGPPPLLVPGDPDPPGVDCRRWGSPSRLPVSREAGGGQSARHDGHLDASIRAAATMTLSSRARQVDAAGDLAPAPTRRPDPPGVGVTAVGKPEPASPLREAGGGQGARQRGPSALSSRADERRDSQARKDGR